jgi:LuxR family transcriptional regulator, quorum-sensing system regulator SolR
MHQLSFMTASVLRQGKPYANLDRSSWMRLFLLEALEALLGAKTTDELRLEVDRFAKEMGFDSFAYMLSISVPSIKPQRFLLNGYPAQWVDRYVSSDYFKIDPLVRLAQKSTLPLIWDEHQLQGAKEFEFWEEAREFGLSGGLSFAVHDQPGAIGIFSMSRDQMVDVKDQELAALLGRGQVFTSLLHQSVCRLELPHLLSMGDIMLTPRERECLKWSAEGKTAWEIGQILGIAERTAVFHINNVVQKLGAANKTQAIVRAVALNLL